MPLRDASEVGVPDVRRFTDLQVVDDAARSGRPLHAPRSRPRQGRAMREAVAVRADGDAAPPAVMGTRLATSPTAPDAGVEASTRPAVKRRTSRNVESIESELLADELQVHVQADAPEVALDRLRLVSFELAEDHPHLRRHQTILGALAWAYVDHTDQAKLDELADLVDAYIAGPWHGQPEVRRLSARMPSSLKRRLDGTVLTLTRSHRHVSARLLLAALVWRYVLPRDEDAALFARLVDVVGAYHQEMARRSLSAPVASSRRGS